LKKKLKLYLALDYCIQSTMATTKYCNMYSTARYGFYSHGQHRGEFTNPENWPQHRPLDGKLTDEAQLLKIAEWSKKWETSGEVAHEIFYFCAFMEKHNVHSHTLGLMTTIHCGVHHTSHSGVSCGTVAKRGDKPLSFKSHFTIVPEHFRIKNDFKDCKKIEDIFEPYKTGDKFTLKKRK